MRIGDQFYVLIASASRQTTYGRENLWIVEGKMPVEFRQTRTPQLRNGKAQEVAMWMETFWKGLLLGEDSSVKSSGQFQMHV